MSDGRPDRTAHRPDDTVERLTNDWLGRLLGQFVRAAGLLHSEHSVWGERISMSEGMALTELAAGAPLTQQQLAERLDLEKSTVSRLIAGLEHRSLVMRRRDPDNRRFAQVSLTEHGRTVTHRMGSAMLERHGHIFAAMTAAERDALTVGLTALVRAMSQAPPMGQ